ncbi:MAG TPA: SpoIIE family protein phosphatase [Bacteroidota bacterium]|nr:SpoIIE family protein phosphatase [Bacteroidota bacterium]
MKTRRSTPAEKNQHTSRFELAALFEFSTVINSTLDLKFILGHFLLTLMGKLLSSRGLVLLRRDAHLFAVEQVKGLSAETIGREFAVPRIPDRLLYADGEKSRTMPWLKPMRDLRINLFVPLVAQKKLLGIAGFGGSSLRKKLSQKEKTYIKSLTNIAASAIEKSLMITELSSVNRRLDSKVQELNTLFELSKEFNSVIDEDRLAKLLMFSVMGQIGASKYVLGLLKNGSMAVVAKRLDKDPSPELNSYLATVSAPCLVKSLSPRHDAHARVMLEGLGIEVLVPLRIQDSTKGVLALGERMRGEPYTETDLELLSSLGNLAIISLENVRLFRETLEKQRLEDELLIAKEIQRGLLPATLPEIPRFDLAAVNLSSKQVGGDYYDVITLDSSHFVIAIGDVSGKGTPASLLMANLQATIRALVPLGLSLAELTMRVNNLICDNTGADRFITFFWGIIDTGSGTMKYVSAGHNPPFLFRRTGEVERLSEGGIILGIMKASIAYNEGEIRFSPGDVLVLFTDGVSEAMNEAGEELGEDPIEEVVKGHLDDPAEEILSAIVKRVKAHSKDTPQSDDITLIVAKTTG